MGRNQVLQVYIDWRITTNQPDTAVYKELKKEEYVEMTQEEFNKLHEKQENSSDHN